MNTKKNKVHNNRTKKNNITISTILVPSTQWQHHLKSVADRDLALIPTSISIKYKLGGSYSILQIYNGKIKIYYSLSKVLREHLQPRFNDAKLLLENLQMKLKKKQFPNITIPLYVGDSYAWDYEGPCLCYSKPKNKNGLLFPHWNFLNWDKTKETFKKECTLPWKERIGDIYFKGDKTSEPHSQIREKLAKIYPSIQLSGPYQPPTTTCKYKYVFDLPGRFPWSVRSPFLQLSNSQIIRIDLFNARYGEENWVQFYDYKDPISLKIKTQYLKPLKDEYVEQIQEYVKSFTKKRSLHKTDLYDLNEEDIAFYLNYLFTKLQKYSPTYQKMLRRFRG
jgi:hypothetical protein